MGTMNTKYRRIAQRALARAEAAEQRAENIVGQLNTAHQRANTLSSNLQQERDARGHVLETLNIERDDYTRLDAELQEEQQAHAETGQKLGEALGEAEAVREQLGRTLDELNDTRRALEDARAGRTTWPAPQWRTTTQPCAERQRSSELEQQRDAIREYAEATQREIAAEREAHRETTQKLTAAEQAQANLSQALTVERDENEQLTRALTNAEQIGTDVSGYISDIDGARVIEIDTTPDTGRYRVYLNDSPIWDGDPDKDEPKGFTATQLQEAKAEAWDEGARAALEPEGFTAHESLPYNPHRNEQEEDVAELQTISDEVRSGARTTVSLEELEQWEEDDEQEHPPVTLEHIRNSPPGSTWEDCEGDTYEWTGKRLLIHDTSSVPYAPHPRLGRRDFNFPLAFNTWAPWKPSTEPPLGTYPQGQSDD